MKKAARTPPILTATQRFNRDYQRANDTLRDGARREANAFVRSAVLHPDWLHKHDKIEGLAPRVPGRFVELEIGSGPRLVAHVRGMNITLVALGGHEVVAELKKQRNVGAELAKPAKLPPGFGVPSMNEAIKIALEIHSAAQAGVADRRRPFGPEVNPDWMYFLSDEQEKMFLGIAEAIENSLLEPGTAAVHLIEGGPGTGKTSVLLNLLDHFKHEDWVVGLDMSEHLVEFIEAQTGRDLTKFTQPVADGEPVRICFVDDPASLEGLRWDAGRAKRDLDKWESTAVVVAFDPLQVEGTREVELTDAALEDVRASVGATRWTLRDCYRQKEKPGIAALSLTSMVMGSSAFLAKGKKEAWATSRAEIAAAALDLQFINPGGSAEFYEDAEWADWNAYLGSVSTETWATAREGDPCIWPRLAVVVPMDAALPATWAPPLERVQHHFIAGPDWRDRLRGVEYAHVAVLLTKSEMDMVRSGFEGSGRKKYERFRLLRIPFSRARDSFAVFGVPPTEAPEAKP